MESKSFYGTDHRRKEIWRSPDRISIRRGIEVAVYEWNGLLTAADAGERSEPS